MYVKTIALREILKNQTLLPKEEVSLFLTNVDTYDKHGLIDFKTLCYFIPNVTYIVFVLSASDHYETFVSSGRFSKVLSKWEEYANGYLKEYLASSGKSYPPENVETIADISARIRDSIKSNNSQAYIYLSCIKIQTLLEELITHCYSEFNGDSIRRRLTISTSMLFEKALYS